MRVHAKRIHIYIHTYIHHLSKIANHHKLVTNIHIHTDIHRYIHTYMSTEQDQDACACKTGYIGERCEHSLLEGSIVANIYIHTYIHT